MDAGCYLTKLHSSLLHSIPHHHHHHHHHHSVYCHLSSITNHQHRRIGLSLDTKYKRREGKHQPNFTLHQTLFKLRDCQELCQPPTGHYYLVDASAWLFGGNRPHHQPPRPPLPLLSSGQTSHSANTLLLPLYSTNCSALLTIVSSHNASESTNRPHDPTVSHMSLEDSDDHRNHTTFKQQLRVVD